MFTFTKMQGAGNDFIVVDGEAQDWPTLAPLLCDRRAGAGADSLLLALPSAHAAVRMRMFNPDGTEDECGNGLRCLALYALRRGLASGPELVVETLTGVKALRWVKGTKTHGLLAAEMGRADLRPSAIPALFPGEEALRQRVEVDGETLEVSALSTGTAHTVVFEKPTEERFQRLSPLLENHPLFPERTSVMWTALSPRTERARVRIWERGAGETLACGTGACAVAVAAFLTGRMGPRISVRSRGGALDVEVLEDLSVRLTGPAAFVYEGTWRG